jgi:acyl-homoserine-lactone acylase
MYVGGGDCWVGVIEFGDTVQAKVLLSYGNATQKNSPHFGDQLDLFSSKQLRDAWLTRKSIDAHAAETEIKTEGGFKTKEKTAN